MHPAFPLMLPLGGPASHRPPVLGVYEDGAVRFKPRASPLPDAIALTPRSAEALAAVGDAAHATCIQWADAQRAWWSADGLQLEGPRDSLKIPLPADSPLRPFLAATLGPRLLDQAAANSLRRSRTRRQGLCILGTGLALGASAAAVPVWRAVHDVPMESVIPYFLAGFAAFVTAVFGLGVTASGIFGDVYLGPRRAAATTAPKPPPAPPPPGPARPAAHVRRSAPLAALCCAAATTLYVATLAAAAVWLVGLFSEGRAGLAGPAALLLFFGSTCVGPTLLRHARRLAAPDASKLLQDPNVKPVLYLRSFLRDGSQRESWATEAAITGTVKLAGGVFGLFLALRGLFDDDTPTFEDEIRSQLRDVGPLVAIGNPQDRLPVLGAARLYTDDASWQRVATDLARRAGLVLWQFGPTAGTLWELRMLVNTVDPRRLVLITPDLLRPSPQREAFVSGIHGVLPKPVPSFPRPVRLIWFDADWTPHGEVLRQWPAPMILFKRRLVRLAVSLRPCLDRLAALDSAPRRT